MERGSKNISLHSNSQRFRTTMDNSTLHSMQKCTCTTANLPVVFCFKPTAYNLHFSESNAGEKKRPIRRNKILKTFPSFNASEGAEKKRHRHIAPWFWKYTKTYIVALRNHHHLRPWKLERGKKNYFSVYIAYLNASEGDGLILNSCRCTMAVHPIQNYPRLWESERGRNFFLYVLTLNATEGVGNGTIMDNSIFNSYRSAKLQFIQSTTMQGHENWNAEEKILLYVPTLHGSEGVCPVEAVFHRSHITILH